MLALQVYALCVVTLAGVMTGVLYDVLRVVRSYLRPRSWAHTLLDLIFWALAAVALGAGLMLANWGDLRGYLPFGALLGVALYLSLASPVVFRLLGVLGRVIYRLLWVLIWPMRKVVGVAVRGGRAIGHLFHEPPLPPPG